MRRLLSKVPAIFLALSAAAFFSCASSKGAARRDDSFFSDENIPLFKEAKLSNGIPLAFKNIPFEKNIEIRVLFLGGYSSCPKNKAGMDQLTFGLLSERNSGIKELSARGLYFPVYSCLADYSYYGFNCAAPDFFESLDAFAASLFSPEYAHKDYLQKEAAASAEALDRSESLGYELLENVKKRIYAQSPYLEGSYYKKTSRVSEYDIEKNLSSLLNASRIQIVAAGNFSYKETSASRGKRQKKDDALLFEERSAALLEKLESLFGTLKAEPWAAPNIPALSLQGKKDYQIKTDFAANDCCAALCVAAPNRSDSDYEAFALASLALDSVLRRELVEAKKIASYAGTAVLNSKQSAALVLMGGRKQDLDYKESLAAALAMFPDYNELESVLGVYKNIYVSRVIDSSHNAGATLDQISSGLVYQNSAAAFVEKPKKIRAATAQDVIGAFEKYFLSENSLFVLLTN